MTPFQPPAPFLDPHEGARVHTVCAAPRTDVQWNRPIFRAPALTPIRNIHSELPFTVVFPTRRAGRTA